VWNRNANRFDPAGLRLKHLAHPFDTPPLGIHHEECFAVCTAEHAREASSLVNDSFQHLAALAHAEALGLTARNARAPDGASRIEADPIPVHLRPDASIRETAVLRDVKGR
jgi:hypothetical protein